MANSLPPPDKLDLEGDSASVGLKWEKWKRSLRLYFEAVDIPNPIKKRATLLVLGGTQLQEIYYNLPETSSELTDDLDVFEVAIHKLDRHFLPKQNKIYERHIFRLIKQELGESFDKFLIKLIDQASKCKFDKPDEHIIDQILGKCRSSELRKKMLTMGDEITLQKVITIANSLEIVNYQLESYENCGKAKNNEVNAIKSRNKVMKSKWERQKIEDKKLTSKCTRCAIPMLKYQGHSCPAKDQKCYGCGKFGHFQRCCRTKLNQNKRKLEQTQQEDKKYYKRERKDSTVNSLGDEDVYYIFNLNDDATIKCEVGGVILEMLIDSGCNLNIISGKTWEYLKQNKVNCYNQEKEPNKILFAYGSKTPLHVKGSFEAVIKVKDKMENSTIYVVDNGSRDLLGRNTAMHLGVLKLGIDINQIEINEKPNKPFPKFKDIVVEIPVDKSVKPVVQPYRRIPIPLEQKINNKIDELLDLDIIEEVHRPSPWVSPMVPILKDNGEIRLCVDMRRANAAILRENHPLPCMENLLPKIKKGKYFSKLDIKNAFHQVELHPDSRYLTTFITSNGLYRYKRLMFGVTCAPELFQKILEGMLIKCEGVINFIDDILVWGRNEEEHDLKLAKVIQVLKKNNVLLNQDKCIYKVKKINFLGHELTEKGVKPLPKYIKSISKFRIPKTIEELQSFLGLANYINKWIPNLAMATEPLKEILRRKLGKKKNIEEYWKDEQSKSFKKIKELLSEIETLGYYDVSDKTQVIADASPIGLGAVLIQTDNRGPRIIAYGNRTLSQCEIKYSQTEKEALALVWAVEHFNTFLFGKEFDLITDHKPLEFLFSPRSKPCARIERWVLRLQAYRYNVKYKPGKTNIADPLSRLCKYSDHANVPLLEDHIHQIVEHARPRAITMQQIVKESENDGEITNVRNGIFSNQWDESIKCYKIFSDELCFYENILLRGNKIVIPQNLRKLVLHAAHEGHPGIVAMKGRLRSKVWWPRIDKDVELMVKSCKSCTLVSLPSPPVPMKRRELPDEPWIDVAIDLLGPLPNNEYILVIIDYYSRYKEMKITKTITSSQIIKHLKEIFSRLGYPQSMTADNGRQFVSEEFNDFCRDCNIKLYNTVPYWPQMNGEVERQNRDIVKRLKISSSEKRDMREALFEYLMMYNSTHHSVTGKTPSELFFKRKNRDKIPMLSHIDKEDDSEVRDRDKLQKEKGKEYGDRKRRAENQELIEGDKVYVKALEKTNKLATTFNPTPHVVERATGGDVIIRNEETGQRLRRNVIHLKRVEGEWKSIQDENLPRTTQWAGKNRSGIRSPVTYDVGSQDSPDRYFNKAYERREPTSNTMRVPPAPAFQSHSTSTPSPLRLAARYSCDVGCQDSDDRYHNTPQSQQYPATKKTTPGGFDQGYGDSDRNSSPYHNPFAVFPTRAIREFTENLRKYPAPTSFAYCPGGLYRSLSDDLVQRLLQRRKSKRREATTYYNTKASPRPPQEHKTLTTQQVFSKRFREKKTNVNEVRFNISCKQQKKVRFNPKIRMPAPPSASVAPPFPQTFEVWGFQHFLNEVKAKSDDPLKCPSGRQRSQNRRKRHSGNPGSKQQATSTTVETVSENATNENQVAIDLTDIDKQCSSLQKCKLYSERNYNLASKLKNRCCYQLQLVSCKKKICQRTARERHLDHIKQMDETELQNTILRWISKTPFLTDDCLLENEIRREKAQRLAKRFKKLLDDQYYLPNLINETDKWLDEILSECSDMPKEKKALKNQVTDDLIKTLVNTKVLTPFEREITDWVARIPLLINTDTQKNKITRDAVKKLKPIVLNQPINKDKYKNNLAHGIENVLKSIQPYNLIDDDKKDVERHITEDLISKLSNLTPGDVFKNQKLGNQEKQKLFHWLNEKPGFLSGKMSDSAENLLLVQDLINILNTLKQNDGRNYHKKIRDHLEYWLQHAALRKKIFLDPEVVDTYTDELMNIVSEPPETEQLSLTDIQYLLNQWFPLVSKYATHTEDHNIIKKKIDELTEGLISINNDENFENIAWDQIEHWLIDFPVKFVGTKIEKEKHKCDMISNLLENICLVMQKSLLEKEVEEWVNILPLSKTTPSQKHIVNEIVSDRLRPVVINQPDNKSEYLKQLEEIVTDLMKQILKENQPLEVNENIKGDLISRLENMPTDAAVRRIYGANDQHIILDWLINIPGVVNENVSDSKEIKDLANDLINILNRLEAKEQGSDQNEIYDHIMFWLKHTAFRKKQYLCQDVAHQHVEKLINNLNPSIRRNNVSKLKTKLPTDLTTKDPSKNTLFSDVLQLNNIINWLPSKQFVKSSLREGISDLFDKFDVKKDDQNELIDKLLDILVDKSFGKETDYNSKNKVFEKLDKFNIKGKDAEDFTRNLFNYAQDKVDDLQIYPKQQELKSKIYHDIIGLLKKDGIVDQDDLLQSITEITADNIIGKDGIVETKNKLWYKLENSNVQNKTAERIIENLLDYSKLKSDDVEFPINKKDIKSLFTVDVGDIIDQTGIEVLDHDNIEKQIVNTLADNVLGHDDDNNTKSLLLEILQKNNIFGSIASVACDRFLKLCKDKSEECHFLPVKKQIKIEMIEDVQDIIDQTGLNEGAKEPLKNLILDKLVDHVLGRGDPAIIQDFFQNTFKENHVANNIAHDVSQKLLNLSKTKTDLLHNIPRNKDLVKQELNNEVSEVLEVYGVVKNKDEIKNYIIKTLTNHIVGHESIVVTKDKLSDFLKRSTISESSSKNMTERLFDLSYLVPVKVQAKQELKSDVEYVFSNNNITNNRKLRKKILEILAAYVLDNGDEIYFKDELLECLKEFKCPSDKAEAIAQILYEISRAKALGICNLPEKNKLKMEIQNDVFNILDSSGIKKVKNKNTLLDLITDNIIGKDNNSVTETNIKNFLASNNVPDNLTLICSKKIIQYSNEKAKYLQARPPRQKTIHEVKLGVDKVLRKAGIDRNTKDVLDTRVKDTVIDNVLGKDDDELTRSKLQENFEKAQIPLPYAKKATENLIKFCAVNKDELKPVPENIIYQNELNPPVKEWLPSKKVIKSSLKEGISDVLNKSNLSVPLQNQLTDILLDILVDHAYGEETNQNTKNKLIGQLHKFDITGSQATDVIQDLLLYTQEKVDDLKIFPIPQELKSDLGRDIPNIFEQAGVDMNQDLKQSVIEIIANNVMGKDENIATGTKLWDLLEKSNIQKNTAEHIIENLLDYSKIKAEDVEFPVNKKDIKSLFVNDVNSILDQAGVEKLNRDNIEKEIINILAEHVLRHDDDKKTKSLLLKTLTQCKISESTASIACERFIELCKDKSDDCHFLPVKKQIKMDMVEDVEEILDKSGVKVGNQEQMNDVILNILVDYILGRQDQNSTQEYFQNAFKQSKVANYKAQDAIKKLIEHSKNKKSTFHNIPRNKSLLKHELKNEVSDALQEYSEVSDKDDIKVNIVQTLANHIVGHVSNDSTKNKIVDCLKRSNISESSLTSVTETLLDLSYSVPVKTQVKQELKSVVDYILSNTDILSNIEVSERILEILTYSVLDSEEKNEVKEKILDCLKQSNCSEDKAKAVSQTFVDISQSKATEINNLPTKNKIKEEIKKDVFDMLDSSGITKLKCKDVLLDSVVENIMGKENNSITNTKIKKCFTSNKVPNSLTIMTSKNILQYANEKAKMYKPHLIRQNIIHEVRYAVGSALYDAGIDKNTNDMLDKRVRETVINNIFGTNDEDSTMSKLQNEFKKAKVPLLNAEMATKKLMELSKDKIQQYQNVLSKDSKKDENENQTVPKETQPATSSASYVPKSIFKSHSSLNDKTADNLREHSEQNILAEIADPRPEPVNTAAYVPSNPIFKNSNDILRSDVEEWVESLPKPAAVLPEDIENIKKAQQSLVENIMEKVEELNLDPEVFNNQQSYAKELDTNLNNVIKIFPPSPGLTENFPAFKKKLIDNILDTREKIKIGLLGDEYQQQLHDTITNSVPVEHLDPKRCNAFEILKDNLADAFLDLHIGGEDEEQKEKFKNVLKDKISILCENYLKDCPEELSDAEKIAADLYANLLKLPLPEKESLHAELEMLKIRNIITDVFDTMPVKSFSSRDQIEEINLVRFLAKRIYDVLLKNRVNVEDEKFEEMVQDEIDHVLNRLPVRRESVPIGEISKSLAKKVISMSPTDASHDRLPGGDEFIPHTITDNDEQSNEKRDTQSITQLDTTTPKSESQVAFSKDEPIATSTPTDSRADNRSPTVVPPLTTEDKYLDKINCSNCANNLSHLMKDLLGALNPRNAEIQTDIKVLPRPLSPHVIVREYIWPSSNIDIENACSAPKGIEKRPQYCQIPPNSCQSSYTHDVPSRNEIRRSSQKSLTPTNVTKPYHAPYYNNESNLFCENPSTCNKITRNSQDTSYLSTPREQRSLRPAEKSSSIMETEIPIIEPIVSRTGHEQTRSYRRRIYDSTKQSYSRAMPSRKRKSKGYYFHEYKDFQHRFEDISGSSCSQCSPDNIYREREFEQERIKCRCRDCTGKKHRVRRDHSNDRSPYFSARCPHPTHMFFYN